VLANSTVEEISAIENETVTAYLPS
jgi:hypothetical protein